MLSRSKQRPTNKSNQRQKPNLGCFMVNRVGIACRTILQALPHRFGGFSSPRDLHRNSRASPLAEQHLVCK